MVADGLRRQADQFIDLVDLEPLIGRDPAMQAPSQPRVLDDGAPLVVTESG